MTADAEPNPDDESVRAAYMNFLAEQYAGEIALNKDSLLQAMESGKYWEAFLQDLAARQR